MYTLKRNIKDPTWHRSQAVLLILGPLILSVQISQAQFYNAGDNIRSDYSITTSWRQNVTCIAHDTKYTCDCHNVNQPMSLPHLDGYVFQVEITNCKSLTIEANVLAETQGLRKITFKNIDNLVLYKYALAFPRYASNTPLIIEFEKVNFELIDSHAINGNIEEISFIGGRIDVIQPFGFTTLKDRAQILKMENVIVKRIEAQAFKKFAVEQMEIMNCVFETNVPSKAFYELEVLNNLRIHNNRFSKVHSRAFSFKLISRLVITGNKFESIDAEWLEAHILDSVTIEQNYFGTTTQISFKAITLHRDYIRSERLELRFIGNTVYFPTGAQPLDFNDRFSLYINQLKYENVYDCKNLDRTQKPPIPKVAFFRNYGDSIYFLRATDASTASASKVNSRVDQSFLALNKIIELDCKQSSYLLYIIIGVVVLVVIILIIVGIVWYLWAKRRKRQKMDVVMPEPRTYKETQIVYQIENAGLLKTDL